MDDDRWTNGPIFDWMVKHPIWAGAISGFVLGFIIGLVATGHV